MTQIGIVVIGRNEGERLQRSLAAVIPMSPALVYVDSASSDGSADHARAMGVRTVELDGSTPLTAARGRNEGFEEIINTYPGCEYVQFIDGDCILDPDWLGSAVDFMNANPGVAVVCGRRFEAHPQESLYNRLIDEEWNTPVGEAQASGGDALVRVSAFRQAGGFNAALKAGEEPEMTARMRALGWKIWRLDVPMAEHDAKIYRFEQWWRRSLRGGYGFAEVSSMTDKHPEPVFGRQLKSAFLWTLAVPATAIVLACILGWPALLFLPAAWTVQTVRIARRYGFSRSAWQSAAMLMLAKLPETIGAFSYFMGGRSDRLAEYKAPR